MRFKNIAKVSDYNYRNYKADFKLLCSQGKINEARNTYKEIFTPNEMIYLEHTWFEKNPIKTYTEDGILFKLIYKTKDKNKAINQTKNYRDNGFNARVKHFYNNKGKIIEYGILKSFIMREDVKFEESKIEEPIPLNTVKEYTNICSKCGAENTLYPYWIGKRRTYKCEKCNQIARGITKKKWKELNRKQGNIDKFMKK